MVLRPCNHCHRSLKGDCEARENLRSQLKGSGILTAAFYCRILRDWYFPGLRVRASFVFYDNGYEICREPVNGTIMSWKKSKKKLQIWFDDDSIGNNGIAFLYPERLSILDCEPLKKICSECGRPEDKANSETWSCSVCETGQPSFEDAHDEFIPF